MNVYWLLPFLEGWAYEPTYKTNFKIGADKESEVFRHENTKGYFFGAIVTSDNPDMELIVNIDGKILKGSATSAYVVQATILQPITFTLIRYNTAGKYTVMYSPPKPLPFRFRIEGKLKAVGADTTVDEFRALCVLVTDPEAFIKSLKSITEAK